MQDNTIIRAGFGPRAAAFLLDQLLVGLALGLVKLPFWIARLSSGQSAVNVLFDFTALDILCYLLLSAYYVLLTYFTGSTLGKKVMGLRVMKEDGAPLRLVDVLYRETIGRYLSGILCLGYLMVLVDGKKRAFHDYLCDTCVVHDHARKTAAADPVEYDYTIPGLGDEPAASAPVVREAPVLGGYTIPSASVEQLPEEGSGEEQDPDQPV